MGACRNEVTDWSFSTRKSCERKNKIQSRKHTGFGDFERQLFCLHESGTERTLGLTKLTRQFVLTKQLRKTSFMCLSWAFSRRTDQWPRIEGYRLQGNDTVSGGGEDREQGSPDAFILNQAIHLKKGKLEPLAESFSSIKDLQSLQPGGGNATSYSCLAVNKISPGMKHFNLK